MIDRYSVDTDRLTQPDFLDSLKDRAKEIPAPEWIGSLYTITVDDHELWRLGDIAGRIRGLEK